MPNTRYDGLDFWEGRRVNSVVRIAWRCVWSGPRCAALIAAACLVSSLGGVRGLAAAEAQFVGVLAIAVEEQAAKALGLSDEVRAKLLALIDSREREALKLTYEIRDLPAAEVARRLVPFVAESERQGLELLTLEQRAKLNQIKVVRGGMTTLADEEVAKTLALSEEQRAKVSDLLRQRAVDLTAASENQRRITQALYEQRLNGLLTPQQRAGWEKLAGLAPGDSVAVPSPSADSSAAAPAPEGADSPAPATAAPEKPAAGADAQAPADQPSSPTAQEPAPAKPAATLDAPIPTPGAAEAAKPATQEEPTPEPAPTAPETAPAQPVATPDASAPTPGAAEPAAPRPAAPGSDAPAPAVVSSGPSGDGLIAFKFQYATWKDVLEWFAQQAGLSLQIDEPPPGSFNFQDDRRYTPSEALDVMNSVLINKGFTLVRRGRMLLLLNLETPIPPELVELVDVSDLDDRGDFELVKCVFHLAKMTPQDAETEITRLLGPGRTIVVLPMARQVLVTETVGKLKVIRSVIEAVENPDGAARKITNIKLNHVLADQVLDVARPLLGLPADQNTNEQINISVDSFGSRIFATGTNDAVDRLNEIVALVDQPQEQVQVGQTNLEQPQLLTYAIRTADPTTVLNVLQTLLAGLPDVRLTVDPASRKVVALARPSDHRTILETLNKLEGESARLEVIPLRRTDPQLVIVAVNKLFGLTAENKTGPQIDADPTTMRLFVRGSEAEIEQIRLLVEKLEGNEGTAGADRGNVRVLPVPAGQVQQALEQLQAVWPSMSGARIRIVAPGQGGPAPFREREVSPDEAEGDAEAPPQGEPAAPAGPDTTSTRRRSRTGVARGVFKDRVAAPRLWTSAPVDEPGEQQEAHGSEVPGGPSPSDLVPPRREPAAADTAPAEIVVTVTPRGLVIASQDTQALDQFEAALSLFLQQSAAGSLLKRDVAVFYLKHAQADVAARLLQDILGGTSSGGAGGSTLTDMASNLLGGGGGLLGTLLGGGGGGGGASGSGPITAGNLSIVADPRLNRLIVQGTVAELDEVEQLLKLIDKEDSITEIQVAGTTHIIQLYYTPAERVATIIQATFADRIAGGQGGQQQQQRQPTPEDFIRALRGGRGGRNEEQARGELPKMTITADAETNSLIVKAPDGLYQQVAELVRLIDQPNGEMSDQVEVLTTNANPQLVQQALAKILGQQAVSSTATGSQQRPGGGTQPGGQNSGDFQQRMEFFRQLREQAQQGGGQPFGGGGPFGRGGAGGGPFGGGIFGAPGGGNPGGGGGGQRGGGQRGGGRGGRQ